MNFEIINRKVFTWIAVAIVVISTYSGFFLTWQCITVMVVIFGALVLSRMRNKSPTFLFKEFDPSINPLKGKPNITIDMLNIDIIRNIDSQIASFVTYDATNTESLHRFASIQHNTGCLFAKKARLWGTPDWKKESSVQENVEHFLPTFLKFTLLCEHLGLDGFVIELPEDFGENIKVFGNTVRDVLKAISSRDPRDNMSMLKSNIDKQSWVFRFHRESFFITTFAQCYPETNSRYSFCSERAYILLQPEISFAQHDIPPDTNITNWDNPSSVRDRIRLAFKEAGRSYKLTKGRPLVYDIVKPLKRDTDFIEWWKNDIND